MCLLITIQKCWETWIECFPPPRVVLRITPFYHVSNIKKKYFSLHVLKIIAEALLSYLLKSTSGSNTNVQIIISNMLYY